MSSQMIVVNMPMPRRCTVRSFRIRSSSSANRFARYSCWRRRKTNCPRVRVPESDVQVASWYSRFRGRPLLEAADCVAHPAGFELARISHAHSPGSKLWQVSLFCENGRRLTLRCSQDSNFRLPGPSFSFDDAQATARRVFHCKTCKVHPPTEWVELVRVLHGLDFVKIAAPLSLRTPFHCKSSGQIF